MTNVFYQRGVFLTINFLFLLVSIHSLIGRLAADTGWEEFYYHIQVYQRKSLNGAELEKYRQARRRFYRRLLRLLCLLSAGYLLYEVCGREGWGGGLLASSGPGLLVGGMRRWEELDARGFAQRGEGEVALAVVEEKSFLGKFRGLFDFGEMKLLALVKTKGAADRVWMQRRAVRPSDQSMSHVWEG